MPPIDPTNSRAVVRKTQRRGTVGRTAPVARKPAAKPRSVSPSGDMRDRQRQGRQTQLSRSVPVTPDQADRKRSPEQKRTDAEAVRRNVRDARYRYVIRRDQRSARAFLTGRGGRTVDASAEFARRRAESRKQAAERVAPVISVLEQTLRPVHGVAAGTRAGIRGENPLPAVGRGLSLKDRSLFSDVLRDLGVKGGAAAAGGFVLDVALDPTTYLTGGTASVARKAATQAAKRVEKKALKAGLTQDQAQRMGQRAAKQAARKAGDARGIDVRFAGRSVPGVTRATAKAGRGAAKVAGRPGRAVSSAARKVAGDFSTGVRPEGIDRATYGGVRSATRTARSSASREVYKVRQRAQAVNRAIGQANYQRVLDAIEAGAIRSLPTDLQKPARFLRDQFQHVRRLEKQAGVKGATRRNYVPHLRTDLAEDGRGIGGQSVGARQIRPSSSKARRDDRTLAQIRGTDPGKYIEDPGVLYAARMSEGATSRAKAELNRRLSGLGRSLPRGKTVSLNQGEAVFHIKGSDIRQLDVGKKADRDELQRFVNGSGQAGGQYVALNAKAVDRALKTVQPGADRSTVGLAFDRAQGVWKFAATQVNPGFHLRNFVGDAQNAYLGQSGLRLPGNIVHASRALTELGRREKALRTLGPEATGRTKGVKIAGRNVPYGDLIREAEKVGGIRSGFVSRELRDLMEGKAVKPGMRANTLRRWLNNREDVMRLATYINARKRGLDPEQASRRVATYHFDYSDLTELERRVMRRIMPFWTFSARNIPLQVRSLISRPGKFAQYEKLRQEISRAFGYEDDWDTGDLPEGEQRSVPIGIRIGGRPYTISLGPSGLPITDLNEFPTTLNPAKQADEWITRAMSMTSPAVKTPVEMWANLSFFFRDQIEKEDAPLVPVSSLVASAIPKRFRDDLGFTSEYVDKRTGKKQWAAPAKIVYALGVLPGPASFLNRVTTPSERAGQDAATKTIGYAGLRVKPVDAISTQVNRLYGERAKVDKRMRALNQQGINAGYATNEYRELSMREKDLTRHIMALRTKRGDKVLPGGRTRLAQPSAAGAAPLDPSELAEIRQSIAEGTRLDRSDLEEIRQQVHGGG